MKRTELKNLIKEVYSELNEEGNLDKIPENIKSILEKSGLDSVSYDYYIKGNLQIVKINASRLVPRNLKVLSTSDLFFGIDLIDKHELELLFKK